MSPDLPRPAGVRRGHGPDLIGIWVSVAASGVLVSYLAALVWEMFRPTVNGGVLDSDSSWDFGVLAVGLFLTLIAATLLTVRADRRIRKGNPPRWAGRWAGIGFVALLLCGVGLWIGPIGIDRWRHVRTTETILGTWHEMIDEKTPWREVTFFPDETCEEHYLSGPDEKQVPTRQRYSISPDGRHIYFGGRGNDRIDVVNRRLLCIWHPEFLGRYQYHLVRVER
jgi:hypothetical protein